MEDLTMHGNRHGSEATMQNEANVTHTDLIDVQAAALDALVCLGGRYPKLETRPDKSPGERSQRRVTVEAWATRLADKTILQSWYWIGFALNTSE